MIAHLVGMGLGLLFLVAVLATIDYAIRGELE